MHPTIVKINEFIDRKEMSAEEEVEIIKDLSGFGIVECACQKCVNMCKRTPCIGTPSEILKLVEAGYGDRLSNMTWTAGVKYGIDPVRMVQLNQNDDDSCVMLKKGRCLLHDSGLKPIEGKTADCSKDRVEKDKVPPTWLIAITWNAERNKEIVKKIKEGMYARAGE